MTGYLTELESHQVFGRYPTPPMTVWTGMLTDAHRDAFAARPVYDVREELVTTDDPALLDTRFVFDATPFPTSHDAPQGDVPPGDAPQ